MNRQEPAANTQINSARRPINIKDPGLITIRTCLECGKTFPLASRVQSGPEVSSV